MEGRAVTTDGRTLCGIVNVPITRSKQLKFGSNSLQMHNCAV
jgi:hypothetical protein